MEVILEFVYWKDNNFHMSLDKDKPYYPKTSSKHFDSVKMVRFEKQTQYTLKELLILWYTKK